ncbi:MAG: hypothetical protein C4278_00150 [Patescibacteria group bacterium]
MLDSFKTANGKNLSKNDLILEIEKFILEDNNFDYKILVGTDSEVIDKKIEFISVIVIHRVGKGGRFFWKKQWKNKPLALYDRLWQEALISLNISQELLKELTRKNLSFYFEIHLDLGNNGRSSSTLKEIINLVKGYGFSVKIKPESYAASKVADKLL